MFGAWAIRQETLSQIHAIYETRLAGEKTDWLKAFEAGEVSPAPRQSGYVVQDGVALVQIEGVMARRMSLLQAMSGGQSYGMISSAISAAVNDDSVDGIVLMVGTPGGEVHGLQPAADLIRSARGSKPIVAWSDSMALSAGYWLASATSRIYAGAQTAEFGSIGVAAVHVDTSKAQEKAGVKRTDLYSGHYKRLVSENKPLDDEGMAYIQSQLDDAYRIFVETVSANRGQSIDTVLADMADGRVFMAEKAMKAGLVDEIASLDKAMADVRAEAAGRRRSQRRERIRSMDRQTLRAENSALYDEIVAEGREAGVTAERERIAQIQASSLPGDEELVTQCIADGTSVADARGLILAAERKRRSEASARDEKSDLAAASAIRAADAQPPLGNGTPPVNEGRPAADERVERARAFAKDKGIDFIGAYRELYGQSVA